MQGGISQHGHANFFRFFHISHVPCFQMYSDSSPPSAQANIIDLVGETLESMIGNTSNYELAAISDWLRSLATWDMTLIYDPNSILQEPEYELI